MEDTLRDNKKSLRYSQSVQAVLILIIMEDTLRVVQREMIRRCNKVLILIIMEDTLRAFNYERKAENDFSVLILIIMEDTLRVICLALIAQINICLNPYYNGRYSTSYLY